MINKIKSLQNNQGFMKYLKNTSWLFVEKILRMVVGLFVGIWIARYLGPEQFGLFSYAQSFVGLFTTIATLGLDSIVVRELVKDEGRSDVLVGTTFGLKLIGALLVLIILAIAVQFTSNDTFTNILIFIIASATIFQSFNVVDFYFQAKVLSKYVVYANVISLFLSSIIKIVLILNNAPLIAFVWVILFDSIILALGFIYFYLKNISFKIKNLLFNKTVAIFLLKNSWPLILSGVVISIYMKIDQVMINEMLGSESVGQYSAAIRLIETFYFIPNILAQSLFPLFINTKKLFKVKLIIFYSILIYIGLFFGLLFYYNSEFIIKLLYGVKFNQSSEILSVYSLSLVIVFLSIGNGKWFIINNLQHKVFYRTIVAMLLNIGFNLLFIPIFGLVGAAYATILSYFLGLFLSMAFFKDSRENFFLSLKAFNLYYAFKFRSIL